MQRFASACAGLSKEWVLSSNACNVDKFMLQQSSQWQYKEPGDLSVSLETGLSSHQGFEEIGPLMYKPYVSPGGQEERATSVP